MQDLKRLNAKIDAAAKPVAKPLPVYNLYANVKLPPAQPWLGDIQDNKNLQAFCDNLGATLQATGAQSLPAPLCNALLQVLAVKNRDGETLILINPRVLSADTMVGAERREFSVSYPGVVVKVARARACTVSYMDRRGEPQEILFTDEVAANVQQGIEVLQGGSILDHLPKTLRAAAIKKGEIRMRKFNAMLKAAKDKKAGKAQRAIKKAKKTRAAFR